MHDEDRLELQRARELPEGHPDSLRHRKAKDRDVSNSLFGDTSRPQDQERLEHMSIPVQIHPTITDRVVQLGVLLAKLSITRRWQFGVRVTLTRGSRVITPPGNLSVRALRFLFSKKAFEAVFAQAVADMREEYFEALNLGHSKKARWIVVRDHIGLALTVGLYVATTMGKKVRGIWTLIS